LVVTSKLKPVLSKEEIFNLDYIKFVLLAAASSPRFGVIRCVEKNDLIFSMRARIHALLISPFGTGKTSQVIQINNASVVSANDITFPGLIGTITKTGEFIIGSCYKAGGKLLVIDEAQRMTKKTKNAMNSLLEPPHTYNRALGYKMLKPFRKRGKYRWVRGSENDFEIGSKFSCIASSMRIREGTDVEDAWNSRFILIRMKITENYMKKLLSGDIIFDINAIRYEGDFTFDDYMRYQKYYWNMYDKSKFKSYFSKNPNMYGYLSRNSGDIIRLAAFVCASENRSAIQFEDVKMIYDKYWKIMMYNMLMAPLTKEEYTILNNIDLTESEIAAILGVSQPMISRYIKGLKAKGLLYDIEYDEFDYVDTALNL